MIALVASCLAGMLVWQATDPPDIARTWSGTEWGIVEAAATKTADAAAAALVAAAQAAEGEGGTASGTLLEFLTKYPQQREQTERELKAMTARQFEAIAESRQFRFDKTTSEGEPRYYLPTGDGHTVIVMFRDGKWSGIQRIRGEHRPDPAVGD